MTSSSRRGEEEGEKGGLISQPGDKDKKAASSLYFRQPLLLINRAHVGGSLDRVRTGSCFEEPRVIFDL